jgi:hypothetical protein
MTYRKVSVILSMLTRIFSNYGVQIQVIKFKFCLVFILIFITACSSLAEKQESEFDPSSVNKMIFRFDPSDSLLTSSFEKKDVVDQVKNNLIEWGYDISGDKTENIRHELSVKIGEIKHDSTPAGFSFSIGNSDPRALDFQKTNILPMVCLLSSKDQSEQSAALTMEVEAGEYLNHKNSPAFLMPVLVDDLSTVCLNLLSHLKVETRLAKATESETKNGLNSIPKNWTPKIRVEVEDDKDEEIDVIEEETKPVPANENNSSDKKLNMGDILKKEQSSVEKNPRKRVIIYNQGSPVIFKFGHERK